MAAKKNILLKLELSSANWRYLAKISRIETIEKLANFIRFLSTLNICAMIEKHFNNSALNICYEYQ